MSIQVFIASDNPDSNHSQFLQLLFVNDIFVRHVLDGGVGTTPLQKFRTALKTMESHPGDQFLYITDKATTSLDETTLATYISSVVANRTFDIFYLGRFQDNCAQLSNPELLQDTGTYVANSSTPHGDLAFMLSPAGQTKVAGSAVMTDDSINLSDWLTTAVQGRELTAVVTSPNLFNYDYVNTASPNYAYTQECMAEVAPAVVVVDSKTVSLAETSTNYGWWFWLFIVLIVFIVILVAVYASYSRRNQEEVVTVVSASARR